MAGSYSPWLMLKDLNGWNGITLYATWFCTFVGIVYQYFFHEKHKHADTLLYLVIGITPGVAIAFTALANWDGMLETALGGLIYILGVMFFKCDGTIPFAHAIWHVFVNIGAYIHFAAISKYLIGQRDPVSLNQWVPVDVDEFFSS